MSVQIPITVANAAALVTQGFTKIEIWSSTDQGNSFQEITSSVIQPAIITSNAANTTFDMNGGTLLKFSINGGAEQSVSFGGSPIRYWTPSQVAAQINLIAADFATTSGSSVVLTSPTTGRASTIKITYNDALDLGFSAGELAIGTDARITLVNSTFIYIYTDLSGATSFQYMWRFSANGVNPMSEYSTPISGCTIPFSVPVSIGTAYFVGVDGRPQKRTIIVGVDDVPFVTSGYAVGNELVQTYSSDSYGFIQVPLIQGSKVRIAIEGTAYVREIIVPSTDTFDIISAMSTATDPFTIQIPPPYITRRGP